MKEYLALEIDVVIFLQQDVVRTSNPFDNGNVFDDDYDVDGDDPYGF